MAKPAATKGHNSAAGADLLSIVERVERLSLERKVLSGDIADVMSEAKGKGFDVKTIRRVIRDRKLEPEELEEEDMLRETYWRAITEGAADL